MLQQSHVFFFFLVEQQSYVFKVNFGEISHTLDLFSSVHHILIAAEKQRNRGGRESLNVIEQKTRAIIYRVSRTQKKGTLRIPHVTVINVDSLEPIPTFTISLSGLLSDSNVYSD